MYLCIAVAGVDTIFNWNLSMLVHFIYLHIVKSKPCNQSRKGLGCMFFYLDVYVTFYVIMYFDLVALILTLK